MGPAEPQPAHLDPLPLRPALGGLGAHAAEGLDRLASKCSTYLIASRPQESYSIRSARNHRLSCVSRAEFLDFTNTSVGFRSSGKAALCRRCFQIHLSRFGFQSVLLSCISISLFSYRFALFWLHETPCGTGQIRDSLNNRSFFVSEFYLTCYP